MSLFALNGHFNTLRCPLLGVKRTSLGHAAMSAFDLGCVKTQKFEKRRELFFSDQAEANPRTNCLGSNCDSEKRSFYRRRAPLRFYTTKTQSGHCAVEGCCSAILCRLHFASSCNCAPPRWIEQSYGRGLGQGDTWPPYHFIWRETSRRYQPTCRGGLPPQPPQNEAMQHQGQRDGEGRHHDQRISCHEKVRRVERKKMRSSRRGHCPHGDCHDEVSDSEKAPGVCCPVRANCVLCQQRSHDDGSDASCNVPNASRQRELPGQVSVSPKYKEYAAPDPIDLSRHEPLQRDRRDQPCDAFRSPQCNGGDSEWDQQTEQYGGHHGRVLYGCEIGICRAEILGDSFPADEHHR